MDGTRNLLRGSSPRLFFLITCGLAACGGDAVPTDLGERIAQLPSKATEMMWSADGQALFIITGSPPTISRIERRGGKTTVLLRSPNELAQLLRAPDGRRLLVRQRGRLVSVPLDGSPPQDLFVPDFGLAVVRAFFAPDGGRLAVVAASEDGVSVTTTVIDPTTRQVLLARAGHAWAFSSSGDRLLFVIENRAFPVGRLRVISVPLAGGQEADEGEEDIGPDERLLRVECRGPHVYLFIGARHAADYRRLVDVGLRLRRLEPHWTTQLPLISQSSVYERVYYFDPVRDQFATWSWACFGAAPASPVDETCSKREYTLRLYSLPFPRDTGAGTTVSNTQLGTAPANGPVAFREDAPEVAVAATDVFILERN